MAVLNRDKVMEIFRTTLLAALDEAAGDAFLQEAGGWQDQDLPRLFKALDAQIEALCERHEIVLVDYEVKRCA